MTGKEYVGHLLLWLASGFMWGWMIHNWLNPSQHYPIREIPSQFAIKVPDNEQVI